ncbi:Nuclear respiratory factor 1 [Anopheles sinensis]|uniref:Nuclear respiratory factor 1 n=1 Tax=Anopheles sinensis TaxID=74873 RepID=A0A084WKT1_ANOSI|nr:Nuclear respiratory factor 1 [Anopheles sinensis]
MLSGYTCRSRTWASPPTTLKPVQVSNDRTLPGLSGESNRKTKPPLDEIDYGSQNHWNLHGGKCSIARGRAAQVETLRFGTVCRKFQGGVFSGLSRCSEPLSILPSV